MFFWFFLYFLLLIRLLYLRISQKPILNFLDCYAIPSCNDLALFVYCWVKWTTLVLYCISSSAFHVLHEILIPIADRSFVVRYIHTIVSRLPDLLLHMVDLSDIFHFLHNTLLPLSVVLVKTHDSPRSDDDFRTVADFWCLWLFSHDAKSLLHLLDFLFFFDTYFLELRLEVQWLEDRVVNPDGMENAFFRQNVAYVAEHRR